MQTYQLMLCRVVIIFLAFVSILFGAKSYPLKDINKELSSPNQVQHPAITPSSIQLIADTMGLIDFNKKQHTNLAHKIRTKQNLVIRIFGDSHIAGDFLPQRLRVLFFKNYHIGFTYPLYPAYHQHIGLKYESSNIEVLNSRKDNNKDYPLGGIIAKPIELPAHITITPKSTYNEEMITQIIFKSPHTKAAMLVTDSKNNRFTINAKNAQSWQNIRLKLHYPIHIQALDVDLLLGGLFITNEGQNNIVENIGINGARSDLWLKWNKDLFAKELSMLPSDLTILCYGSNDAMYDTFNQEAFLDNYGTLIDIIYKANPQTTILLLSPPPVVEKRKKQYKITKHFEAIKKAIYTLAKQKQVLFFDMEYFIKQSGGKKKWEEADLAKPDVHLQPMGYKLVADKIYYELGKLQ